MRIFSLSLFLLSAATLCSAQKLPSTQSGPVKAPANIKVDGKATEWGDKFKAYNKNIEAFYTIANNDSVLYFTLKATKHDIIDKILRGGVSLIINHTTSKNDPDAVSLTYPILRGTDMSDMTNALARRSFPPDGGDTLAVKGFNALFDAHAKVLDVSGIKAVTEKQLSVYNEEGIKVSAALDGANALTYELAIPLKYLNLPGGGKTAFSYHVKINELPIAKPATGGMFPPPMVIGGLGTTDFWGEYTLAK